VACRRQTPPFCSGSVQHGTRWTSTLVFNRAALIDVEQTVLGARFAVGGHDRVYTLSEISTLLNLSKERIRQVQNMAVNKLRLALEPAFSPAMAIPGKRRSLSRTS
jgi:DNA-directed RNA polymerase sigma subunit (sigma70/sigma32)